MTKPVVSMVDPYISGDIKCKTPINNNIRTATKFILSFFSKLNHILQNFQRCT